MACMRSALRSLLTPLALIAAVGACTEPAERTPAHEAFTALAAEAYAWAAEPMDGPERAQQMLDDDLLEEARGALESALSSQGFRVVDEDDADFMLAFRVDVTSETRTNDPFFSVYSVERFERGHLTLAAFTPLLFDDLWEGRADIKLRDTARAIANQDLEWTELDETRSWDFDAMARNLARRMAKVAR